MKENLVISMSGGTTTVINSTLAGIISKARKVKNIDKVYAGSPGIIGILNEKLIDLTDLSDEELNRLIRTPASGFIGTTRVKPLLTEELQRLDSVFQAHQIGYFVNIGGNGTIKQSVQVSEYLGNKVKVASLPKTVDNDLGDRAFEQVYYTPGYPSCANYWMHKILMFNQENLGAFSHDQVLIAQTFGRKTGFIAACSRLADRERQLPLLILLPEDQQSTEQVIESIREMISQQSRAIVIISEGYDIDSIGEKYDLSEQIMYSSSQTTAAQLLVNKCMEVGIQARHFIPGFDQRCDIAYTLENDIRTAYEVGAYALAEFEAGNHSFLASIGYDSNSRRPKYLSIPFEQIKDFSRVMPEQWIEKGGFDVSDAFIEYAAPLVDDHELMIGMQKSYHFLMPLASKVSQKTV